MGHVGLMLIFEMTMMPIQPILTIPRPGDQMIKDIYLLLLTCILDLLCRTACTCDGRGESRVKLQRRESVKKSSLKRDW